MNLTSIFSTIIIESFVKKYKTEKPSIQQAVDPRSLQSIRVTQIAFVIISSLSDVTLSETDSMAIQALVTEGIRVQHCLNYDCVYIKQGEHQTVRNPDSRSSSDQYRLKKSVCPNKFLVIFRSAAELVTYRPCLFQPIFKNFSGNPVSEIESGECHITNAESTKPVLAASYLVADIAFVAFNAPKKIGILAKIDPQADVTHLFVRLDRTFSAKEKLTFVCRLVGGFQEALYFQRIKEAAAAAEHVTFILPPSSDPNQLKLEELKKGPCLGPSARLNKSVAFDTRAEVPLNVLSYEPALNPLSLIQNRESQALKRLEFEEKRKTDETITVTDLRK